MMLGVVAALLGALVAGAFAVQLAQQHRRRRRHHALAWTLALALYALGMVVLAVGLGLGWSPLAFAVYWGAGALLNVALLGVGQLQLLDPDRAALWWTLGGLAAAWTVVALLDNPPDPAAVQVAVGDIPGGEAAFGGGLAWQILTPITTTATLVVVAGSAWSSVRTRRFGLLLIPLGVLVSGSSSAFLRLGATDLVPVVLAVGVAVMYLGFRAAAKAPRPSSRAARRVESPPGDGERDADREPART